MTRGSTSTLLSLKAFYWKKPLFGRSYWSACKLDLLANGWMVWSKEHKKKGSICLTDVYDEIKVVHADERRFFNAIPWKVRMAPYVLLIPIMRIGGIEEEICFVLESEEEVLQWLRTLAQTLDAVDLFEEERRRADKELSAIGQESQDLIESAEDSIKRLVLPSAWYQFKNALKSMDGRNAVRISWNDV